MNGLLFEPGSHSYYLDGQPVGRSVTQVLHRAGIIDYSAVPAGILENARRRGVVVHQAIHYMNHGDLDRQAFDLDYPDLVGYIDGWQSFCHQRKFQAYLSEWRICSPTMDVAGTADCFGELDGSGVLLDFATGDPADAAKDLQTAAYVLLAWEWSNRDIQLRTYLDRMGYVRRYGVALHRDGTFRLEHYDNRQDFQAFRVLAESQRIIDARRTRKDVA